MKSNSLGMLLACLVSCSSQDGRDDSQGTNAVSIYRGLNGRFSKLPACVEEAFEGKPGNAADLDAALSPYTPLLEELAQAVRASRCTWDYDIPPSLAGAYPLDFVLTAGKLLVVRARVQFEKRSIQTALGDLIVLSKFGSDLMMDRWMIGHVSGMICIYWSCDEVRGWIRRGGLQRPDLERMAEHLQGVLSQYPSFLTWLRTEKEMALPLLEEIRDLGLTEVMNRVARQQVTEKDPHPAVVLWEQWLRKLLEKDMVRVKERVSKRWDELLVPLEKELQLPINSRKLSLNIKELKNGGRVLAERMARHTLGVGGREDEAISDVADLLFRLWMPASEKLLMNHAKTRLLLDTTAVSCQLELFRLKSGSFPAVLSDIVKVPDDPFDGGLLQYRRVAKAEGEGYVIAAAGPKADGADRIRIFVDECSFDDELFEKMGYGDSVAYTFGVFRRR